MSYRNLTQLLIALVALNSHPLFADSKDSCPSVSMIKSSQLTKVIECGMMHCFFSDLFQYENKTWTVQVYSFEFNDGQTDNQTLLQQAQETFNQLNFYSEPVVVIRNDEEQNCGYSTEKMLVFAVTPPNKYGYPTMK